MPTPPDRETSPAAPGAEPRPEPAPERSGGVEGGAILVGLILVAGVVLLVLKLVGVLE